MKKILLVFLFLFLFSVAYAEDFDYLGISIEFGGGMFFGNMVDIEKQLENYENSGYERLIVCIHKIE